MLQGGPLSPLLSNILLDELDKELERRGHSFCRYADDCNIYVSSRKAGDHLLKNIRAFVENKLKVNEKKSAVARPWDRKFLGYSVTWHKQAKLKIAPDEREQAEGESPQSDDGKPEQISESDNQCSDTSAVWMDKLLQADGSQRSAGGAGWLDQTENCVVCCSGSGRDR